MHCNIIRLCYIGFLHLFALLPVTLADYYIDNANSTVQYTSNKAGIEWYHYDYMGNPAGYNFSLLYNRTLSVAGCLTTASCSVAIPFHGSGITLRGVLMPNYTDFSVSLDGKMAAAPPTFSPLNEYQYNVSLYDIQSLPLTNHKLTVSLISHGDNATQFLFDYAYINETAPTRTSLKPPRSKKRSPVGPIVEGIVGGLVAIAILACAIRCCRRKRRASAHAAIVSDPNRMPFDSSNVGPHPSYTPQPSMAAYTPTSSALNTTTPPYPNRPPSISAQQNVDAQTTSPSSADFLIPPMPLASPASSANQSGISPAKNPNDGLTSSQRTAASDTSNQLTDEQTGFVNSLYNRNTPAPAHSAAADDRARRA